MNSQKKRKELTEKQKMRYLSDKYPALKQLIQKLNLQVIETPKMK
jgi:hypothetical protein